MYILCVRIQNCIAFVFISLEVAMIVITQSQKALLRNVEVLYQALAKITPRAMAAF